MWVSARFGVLVLALLYMLSVGLSQLTNEEVGQVRQHLQSTEKQAYQIEETQDRVKALEQYSKENEMRLTRLEKEAEIGAENKRLIWSMMIPLFVLGIDALIRMVTRGMEIVRANGRRRQ